MRTPIVFGKYLLLERISVGGMAEVFKARAFGEHEDEIIAIKRILPSMAEDQDFIAMFIDEAKIAGQLSHSNICPIFELGKIDNSHFIAMAYVSGKDLLQIQNRFRRLRRRMPLPMAAYIASEVCEGLDYAHRCCDESNQPLNIVHRDVSPQNILVSFEGEVKIIDFGIAKAVSRSSKTQAGVLKGKFGYMSPEQVRGQPLDRRSDVFAIGTLLWEMCTDQRLFTGSSDFAVLEKVRNAQVPPPSVHNPMIPPELEAIIMRALKRDSADRFQWATEMKDSLSNYLMAQSPVWQRERLAETIWQLFEREMAREQAAFEQYSKISRDDLHRYESPPARSDVAVSLLTGDESAMGSAATAPSGQAMQQGHAVEGHAAKGHAVEGHAVEGHAVEGESLPTQVGGPSFDPAPEAVPTEESEEIAIHVVESEEMDALATRVWGYDATSGSLPAEPTFIFNAELGQVVHAAERSLLYRADAVHAGDNGESSGAGQPASTVVFDVEAEVGQSSLPQPPAAGGETVPVASKSGTSKDIMIGVLSAALLLLVGVMLWRHWYPEAGHGPSALVVSSNVREVAEVLVDGRSVGQINPRSPITLKGIKAGRHRLVLLPDNGDPVTRTIRVGAGEVKIVALDPKREKPVAWAEDAPRSSDEPDLGSAASAAARAHVSADGGAARPRRGRRRSLRDAGPRARSRAAAQPTEGPGTGEGGQPRVRSTKTSDRPPTQRGVRSPRKSARSSAVGYLVANSVPWAMVWVDGEDTGRMTPVPPKSKISLSVGTHTVTFVHEGRRFSFVVRITRGQTTRLIEKLPVE